jgi:hypothetical protein
MGQMMKLLKEKDPTLHKHLVSHPYTHSSTKFSMTFLSAAKGWYGPDILWISLDHSAPISRISPPR